MLPAPDSITKGKLTDNESSYILDSTLKRHHRNDAVIIGFIEAFVRCKSISQASSEVGIDARRGYGIRHRTDVSNAITKIWEKSAIKYGFDSSEIFERVKEVVDFDPVLVMNQDGTFKSNMFDIPPEARRCLKKLKVKNLYSQEKDLNGIDKKLIIGEVIEYEFYDKLKGAELVGREKEMFKTVSKVEHAVTKDMATILLASAERADTRKIEDKTVVEADYKEMPV